jgi:hypothetical protein
MKPEKLVPVSDRLSFQIPAGTQSLLGEKEPPFDPPTKWGENQVLPPLCGGS